MMNATESKVKVFVYETSPMVCSRAVRLEMKDNVIEKVEFAGGCPGNQVGIARLVKGMEAEKAIGLLEGVHCGGKPTSCPDQLAQALKQYLSAL